MLGKSEDQAAKYRTGLAEMGTYAFAAAKREWNGRFTGAFDRLCVESRPALDDKSAQSLVLKAALAVSMALEDGGDHAGRNPRQSSVDRECPRRTRRFAWPAAGRRMIHTLAPIGAVMVAIVALAAVDTAIAVIVANVFRRAGVVRAGRWSLLPRRARPVDPALEARREAMDRLAEHAARNRASPEVQKLADRRAAHTRAVLGRVL